MSERPLPGSPSGLIPAITADGVSPSEFAGRMRQVIAELQVRGPQPNPASPFEGQAIPRSVVIPAAHGARRG